MRQVPRPSLLLKGMLPICTMCAIRACLIYHRLSPTTIYRPSPTATTPLSQKHALSDTSLAILESKNGDRHLFFQERSGNIRQGIYSASTQKWIASSNSIVATDAKNHTPIAAIRFTFLEIPPVPSPNVRLFLYQMIFKFTNIARSVLRIKK